MNRKRFAILLMLFLLVSLSYYEVGTSAGSEVHDVAVVYATVFPTEKFYLSSTVGVNVTVENQGTSHETFNVTVYADNLTIQRFVISDLAPGTNTTLTFEEWGLWYYKFTIFPPPWYYHVAMVTNVTISAQADVVPGEIDTSDNAYIDGTIQITWMPQDVTGDGRIDGKDIALVSKAFGSYPGHPRWNPDVDINQDGKIDGKDLGLDAKFFGWHY